MSANITGLDDLQKKLQQLAANAKALDGKHNVGLNELFPPSFVRRYTQFASIDELFAQSGFKVETQADFEAVPSDQWDIFIKGHTQFASWQQMKEKAGAEWTKGKLGL